MKQILTLQGWWLIEQSHRGPKTSSKFLIQRLLGDNHFILVQENLEYKGCLRLSILVGICLVLMSIILLWFSIHVIYVWAILAIIATKIPLLVHGRASRSHHNWWSVLNFVVPPLSYLLEVKFNFKVLIFARFEWMENVLGFLVVRFWEQRTIF